MELEDFKRREIEITADGSATIFLPSLNEHYHSVKGALTESDYIFLDCGLRHSAKKEVNILEIGFGTGLNAVVTACGCKDKQLHYYTLERFPLAWDEVRELHYEKLLDAEAMSVLEKIHRAEWESEQPITENFGIIKKECDLTLPEFEFPQGIDVVYFDAFAPEKQPEMWSDEVFQKIYDCMNVGGILTTYCAKGEIRRRMQSIGFRVERLQGPPNGKREILRGSKE